MEYVIRRAQKSDIDRIITFYNLEWKKSQIMNNRDLFEYYFVDNDKVNFIIAEKKENIVGIVAYTRLTSNLSFAGDFFVKKGESPLLCFKILEKAKEVCGEIASINVTPEALKVCAYMGYEVKKMDHYYMLNDRNSYECCIVEKKQILPEYEERKHILENVSERRFKEECSKNAICEKEMIEYYIKRFYRFPCKEYVYSVCGVVSEDENINAFFVVRYQVVGTSKVMRIVYYIGSEEEIPYASHFFKKKLKDENLEYVDFLNAGIDGKILRKAGFSNNDEQDPNIIPDLLNPLVMKKTSLYAYGPKGSKGFRFFKADGDQDRPNLIRP